LSKELGGIDLASKNGFIKKTLSEDHVISSMEISSMKCEEDHVGTDDDEEEED
jgi:hypothetical protein